MKKIIALLLTVTMIFSLAACSLNTQPSESEKKPTYKIGICNYVDDASLNQIVENIENELKLLSDKNGVTFEISYDNCNMDQNVLTQIISNFKANGVDLMVGVATPVAVSMQTATEDTDIPVIFSAVSDPVSTGLVENADAPEGNLTGTSDYLDTHSIFDIAFTVNPDIKTVGLLYDVGQDSSTTPITNAKKYLDEKGVKYIEKTGTNADEVMLAAKSLVSDGVDMVFTPTDNTIMASELAIYETFADAKIPHYAGADSFALNGAFLGYGVDYANLGKETAKMVCEVLVNKKAIKDLPVQTFDNGIATVNTEICEKLGLDINEIKEKISPLCTGVSEIKTAESFE